MKRGLLLVFIAALLTPLLAGCDGCKSQVQSLFYEEVDRTVTPTDLRLQEEGRLEEVEPNDKPEDATIIEVRREVRPTTGAIDPEGDVDWFRLVHQESEAIIVELTVTPRDRELDLALFVEVDVPGDSPALLYDLGGPGEPESVPMLRVPPGEGQRFFVVGVQDSTGEYRIEARRRLSAGAVAVEPNDHPALASPLQIPGEVQGFYDRPHDRDIFFVPAESLDAGVYRLEVSHIPEIPQTLEIYGDKELGERLLQIEISDSRPAVIPNISLHSGVEGLYFVLTAGPRFNRERGYRLRVIEHPPSRGYTIEREPNDTESSAQRVKFGERVRGYLHTRTDRDRFRFVIEAEEEEGQVRDEERMGSLDEELDDESPVLDRFAVIPEKERPEYVIQTRLRPLNESHRLGMRWIPGEGTGESPNELHADSNDEGLILCNHVLGPGAYDVEVRSLQTEEGFRPGSFDYEIEFLNIASMEGLEVEPNDSPETADRLAIGSPRVGFISEPGDVDYFGFVVGPELVIAEDSAESGTPEASEGEDLSGDDEGGTELAGAIPGAWEAPETESVRIRLRGNRLNLGFELLDDEGGRVANVNRGGPGADEELEIDLPHGLYYLAIRASSGSLCEPYQIQVTKR